MLLLPEMLALAAAYYACGKLGLSMAFFNASASPVWPPTGLALAVLLWRGRRLWPGVFVGAFLVNITTQGSLPVTLGIAAGNSFEALLAAWFVCRFANGLKAFESTRGAFRFILLAALISTTVSPTIGVTSLCLGGFGSWADYGTIWLTWWLGDMVSNLIIAPLLVVWMAGPLRRPKQSQVLESAGLLCLIVFVGEIVFLGKSVLGQGHRPLEFLCVPPLLWAAFRFGARGAISSAFAISALALWGTLRGLGPFARSDPNESLLLLQAFMGAVTMTALVLGLVVSERKRAEMALAQNRDELENVVRERTAKLSESVAELEAFSYSITHDLRAPLRAMQNFAAMLEEDYQDILPPSGLDYSRRIREASRRMDQLINDSLSYSCVVREERPLQAVDLGQLLRGIVETYPNLQPLHADIELQINGLRVLGNQSGLTQCFSNLLGNAVKFVSPGIRPHVRVRAENKAAGVRIWVEDNGIGIPVSAQTKLFGMFQRLHHQHEYPGTGIGLAIVRKAVERMNGKVGVESEPGQGSRFWVELPLPKV